MSDRRRLLLTLLNQGVWLPYSFEYLYHDLIPTTISGKQVKNKLKLATIYGNSVVKNQLNDDAFMSSSSNYSTSFGTLIVANNELTYEVNNTSNANILYKASGHTISFIKDHKYLFMVKAKTSSTSRTKVVCQVYNGSSWSYIQLDSTSYKDYSMIVSFSADITNQSDFRVIQVSQSQAVIGDTVSLKALNIIDLTQAYPFDTPTTLTDNRVQAILNNGYIPYNTGTIENTDIGEFESEPYNLFDEELEQGNIQQANGQNALGNQYRSTNYTNVLPNRSFTFEYNRSAIPNGSTYFYLYEYDKNHNYIDQTLSGNTNDSITFTTTPQTSFIRFKLYNSTDFSGFEPTQDILKCCLHRTGTRTGYAPHTQPQTISFKYQGSGVGTSHDSMTIDKDNVVFVKNFANADLSTLTFTHDTTNDIWYSVISSMVSGVWNTKPNILCDKYATYESKYSDELSSVNKICTIWSTTNRFLIKDTSITQASDITGTLTYQLATPQTITIPRKKLGIKRIKDLSWSYYSGGAFFYATINDIKQISLDSTIPNIYCKYFMTIDYIHFNNLTITQNANSSLVRAKDTSFNTIDDFLDKYGDYLIFYETQDEVADIIDTIGVEASGTFTSDSEVLPNVDTKIKGK